MATFRLFLHAAYNLVNFFRLQLPLPWRSSPTDASLTSPKRVPRNDASPSSAYHVTRGFQSHFRDMCHRGYDMVPVNPVAGELESRCCFGRVEEINPPAEGALVMTAPPRHRTRGARLYRSLCSGGM